MRREKWEQPPGDGLTEDFPILHYNIPDRNGGPDQSGTYDLSEGAVSVSQAIQTVNVKRTNDKPLEQRRPMGRYTASITDGVEGVVLTAPILESPVRAL